MNGPQTREAAAARARAVLGAEEVEPYAHPELEDDRTSGGFAFVAGERGAIIGYDGGYQTSVLALAGETMDTLIIGWLVEQRHRKGPTRPCPICGTPTGHLDRHPSAVCVDCQSRATDAAGRPVIAFNEGPGIGLIVFYSDSPDGRLTDVSADVMETGRCWIDGIECSMAEARFGGVVVQRVMG